jgi:hypothetical protein
LFGQLSLVTHCLVSRPEKDSKIRPSIQRISFKIKHWKISQFSS